jgi:hypothetical protein
MRVRLIKEMDFRRNDRTLYLQVEKDIKLGPRDVACFVAKSRNQILFVHRPSSIETRYKSDPLVYHSIRLRLSHGTWDPLMLKEYAAEAGIQLEGLMGLKEVLRRVRSSVAEQKAAA